MARFGRERDAVRIHVVSRVEAYLPRLFGYAMSLVRDRSAAEDLVQECVLRALGARRSPDHEAAYRAWLFRILRNAFIDQLRRAGREIASGDEPEPEIESSAMWRFDERLISALTVERGMARLCRPHREIVALVDIAGFSYREAAEFLDIPQGTVMSRLSRARLALLDAIAEGNVRPLPLAARRSRR